MRVLCAAAVVSVALAGCGVNTPDVQIPTFPAPSGDTATFSIDGQTVSVQQSGFISVSIGQAPEVSYSGPLGCAGHYFASHLTEHIRLLFRYRARDAYLYVGTGDLYHFHSRPVKSHGQLVWSQTFPDRGRISVFVKCGRRR